MGLESRPGGTYYYRKKWVDGTCRSIYRGGGVLATLDAKMDECRRELAAIERAKERDELQALKQEHDEIDANLDTAQQMIDEAVRSAIEGAGYHEHRGQWRRRRRGEEQ